MPTYSIARSQLLESGLRDVLLQCNDCLEHFGAELHPALVTDVWGEEIHPAAFKVMTATGMMGYDSGSVRDSDAPASIICVREFGGVFGQRHEHDGSEIGHADVCG